LGSLRSFLESHGSGDLESHLRRVDFVIRAIEEDWLPPGVKARMKEFVQLIEDVTAKALRTVSLSQLTLALLAKTEYLQRLKEEGTDEALSKVENVDELINVMMGLEQGEEKVSLESFLDKVSLVTDVDLYEDKGNRVSLMTLHCAKGWSFLLSSSSGWKRDSSPTTVEVTRLRISRRKEGSAMWGSLGQRKRSFFQGQRSAPPLEWVVPIFPRAFWMNFRRIFFNSKKKGEDRNLKVFKDREFGKNVHDLEGTADPFLHPLMDREMSNLFVTEKDFTRISQEISSEEVDKSGLTCSIWTH
jgi:hypothetical protein